LIILNPIASLKGLRLKRSRSPPGLIEADGYRKVGPGPIEAIRFKWTVRRGDNDEYYVDETIATIPIRS